MGKSLIAAALAGTYAQAGANTLLVNFDSMATVHPVYGIRPEYQAQSIGDNLSLSRVHATQALTEYVRRKMTLSLVYEGMLANPMVQKFLDALPLFDELMCLGKLYDLTTHADSPYDQVVFDAPATGHCKILLNVPEVAVKTLVAGPIYDNAQKIISMLQDPGQTELLIVTLAEETPVREALELREFARQQARVTCNRILVNRVLFPAVGEQTLSQLEVAAQRYQDLSPVVDAVALEHDIARSQQQHIEQLLSSGADPLLVSEQAGTGAELLAGIARSLREQMDA